MMTSKQITKDGQVTESTASKLERVKETVEDAVPSLIYNVNDSVA